MASWSTGASPDRPSVPSGCDLRALSLPHMLGRLPVTSNRAVVVVVIVRSLPIVESQSARGAALLCTVTDADEPYTDDAICIRDLLLPRVLLATWELCYDIRLGQMLCY
uniref:Uncharacterized protein n=1 Tax=Plectus sambesii TaxID=2011161 RepID=A0A914V3E9_9BILA